jgi:hypothetical protein
MFYSPHWSAACSQQSKMDMLYFNGMPLVGRVHRYCAGVQCSECRQEKESNVTKVP